MRLQRNLLSSESVENRRASMQLRPSSAWGRPIELGYSREHNFLMSRARGKIVLADLLVFHDRMDKLNVAADCRSLADYRSADLSSLSSSDIRRSKERGNEVAI